MTRVLTAGEKLAGRARELARRQAELDTDLDKFEADLRPAIQIMMNDGRRWELGTEFGGRSDAFDEDGVHIRDYYRGGYAEDVIPYEFLADPSGWLERERVKREEREAAKLAEAERTAAENRRQQYEALRAEFEPEAGA